MAVVVAAAVVVVVVVDLEGPGVVGVVFAFDFGLILLGGARRKGTDLRPFCSTRVVARIDDEDGNAGVVVDADEDVDDVVVVVVEKNDDGDDDEVAEESYDYDIDDVDV